MTSVRVEAARLLGRILRGGAYSNVVVDTATRDRPEADRAAIRSLVYGALRALHRSDQAIGAASSRPLNRIQPAVLDVLRVAVGELLSGSTEPHAAVSEGVEAVRASGHAGATGFANAVLRRIAAEGASLIEANDAGRLGVAPWLLQRLDEAWGESDAVAFTEASIQPARLGIRLRPGQTEATGESIGEEVPGIPNARTIEPAGLDRVRQLLDSGTAVVTDAASVAVAEAVEARPGMVVLDAAAAPGGKTSSLWDAMEGTGRLVAADRHARRVAAMRRRFHRLRIRPDIVVADASEPPFRAAGFDRVLLDAPCTGLGTWRRRPEIPLRLEASDPARLGAIQKRLLRSCLRLVKPGGRLVYAVCTVFPEETIDVVAGLDAHPPEDLPGRRWGSGLLMAPHITGTDGMFIAVIDV